MSWGANLIQSSRDLRYLLLSGPVSLQSLRILNTHQTDWGGFKISFYVLAVSHAMSLEFGSHKLTEFLSCVPIQTEAKVITQITTSELPWETSCSVSGVEYSCRLSLADDSEGDGFRNSFETDQQISAFYPNTPGFPATPVTRIGWRLKTGEIFVETIHSYPEESQVVRSESIYRFMPVQA
jgi:hypothetical protein